MSWLLVHLTTRPATPPTGPPNLDWPVSWGDTPCCHCGPVGTRDGVGARDADRDCERDKVVDRDRERDRETDREPDRDGETDLERDADLEVDRGGEGGLEWDREPDRVREGDARAEDDVVVVAEDGTSTPSTLSSCMQAHRAINTRTNAAAVGGMNDALG